ncbi:DEAD/DEAH box helicase [Actinotalea ferrariae CF5-4]|uniref:DEAD/DEAH box helicase n=1 Tax=Actinotalea ferrariae CF5-4 TaxID=948458 RepID=A0A021VVG6_9CELL|nr:DEAD/DEAH box helicase [Actinotalea ferrariae]EYR63062.1 DEAD/DEAH box helicase [Actinotalea ferrariae CF5-4]
MVDSARLLDVLLAGGRRADRATHVEHLPARVGRTAPWPDWADARLVAGYRSLGVAEPWEHQLVAAEAAWAGRHTVLATSTGSGKSLAFWLPALTAVQRAAAADVTPRRGSVLYLCPTKALAADQLAGLERLLQAGDHRDLRPATCDGDTGPTERRWVHEYADVVLTNPDFLHFSLLPGHRRWARLLRGLRYVVVDECHAYRGVFGAHVAAVLRRLRRVAAHYGSDPTFVLASATTAEPAASAARLLGVSADDVVAVTDDASPQGRKTFALWQPPELPGQAAVLGEPEPAEVASLPRAVTGTDDDAALAAPGESHGAPPDGAVPPGAPHEAHHEDAPTAPAHRTATAEMADLLADLVLAGARTLAFARSRRAAESVAAATQDHLDQVRPGLGRTVAAYRGGYLPEERRALEHAIRSGDLQALATTNALELGVDISGLDAVLIAGWPGTRMSLWQQAGRAGRAGSEGLVALIAREDPLDTYLVHHPEAVFGAPVEATVFDPGNPYVLGPHLCAAAAEVPLRSEDLPLFGPGTAGLLDVLVDRGALRRRSSGWYWTHPEPATRLTDLRGSGGEPVRVVEVGTGRLLGTVDAGSADATVHAGAVYVHQGATYLVEELDLEQSVAMVTAGRVDYGTWSRWLTSIEIRGVRAERTAGPVRWGFGAVDVTTQVVSYQKRRLPEMTVLGQEPLDLPTRTLPTTAVWWTAPVEVLAAARVDDGDVPGALHAAEHASIGLLPLLATCDRWDLGGVSTALHVDTECATVFVHDAYPGGAGFAERGFELGPRWLRATRDAIATCGCSAGCPACVQSPKCGNGNNPLEKDAAVRLLDAVLAHDA